MPKTEKAKEKCSRVAFFCVRRLKGYQPSIQSDAQRKTALDTIGDRTRAQDVFDDRLQHAALLLDTLKETGGLPAESWLSGQGERDYRNCVESLRDLLHDQSLEGRAAQNRSPEYWFCQSDWLVAKAYREVWEFLDGKGMENRS